jgi:hypothetical protein
VKIANKELYNLFNKRLEQNGFHGVSPSTFKGYLADLGFSKGVNRKKLKVRMEGEEEPSPRLCNIFDPRVLRKLGIKDSHPSKIESAIIDLFNSNGKPLSYFLVEHTLVQNNGFDQDQVFHAFQSLRKQGLISPVNEEYYVLANGSQIHKSFPRMDLHDQINERLRWIKQRWREVDESTLRNKLLDLISANHFDDWLAKALREGRLFEATPGRFEVL